MFEMWTIENAAAVLVLCSLAVIDIRKRRLPLYAVLLLTVLTVCYRMGFRQYEVGQYIGGAFLGMAFFGISFLTREALGYGDSWMILILGVFLGFGDAAVVLLIAFLIAGIYAGGYLVVKRIRRKTGQQAFPFLPMLAISYLGFLMCG